MKTSMGSCNVSNSTANASKSLQENITCNDFYMELWSIDGAFIRTKISCYAFITVFISCGNCLCLVAFYKAKSLRKRPFYLLASLCVADLLVGVSAGLTWFLELNYLYSVHINEMIYILINSSLGVFSSLTSIFTLAAISIERFIAVVFPFYHRTATTMLFIVLIGIPWFVACCEMVLFLCTYYLKVTSEIAVEYSLFVMATVPLMVVVVAYFGVLIKVKRSHIRVEVANNVQVSRDRKLAVTLFVMTVASFVTWLPFNIYRMVVFYWSDGKVCYPDTTLRYLIMLQYLNSAINFVVYMFRLPQFRQAVHAIFCVCRPGITNVHRGVPVSVEQTQQQQDTSL